MPRLMVGAVAYGAHVVPIWEGIRRVLFDAVQEQQVPESWEGM